MRRQAPDALDEVVSAIITISEPLCGLAEFNAAQQEYKYSLIGRGADAVDEGLSNLRIIAEVCSPVFRGAVNVASRRFLEAHLDLVARVAWLAEPLQRAMASARARRDDSRRLALALGATLICGASLDVLPGGNCRGLDFLSLATLHFERLGEHSMGFGQVNDSDREGRNSLLRCVLDTIAVMAAWRLVASESEEQPGLLDDRPEPFAAPDLIDGMAAIRLRHVSGSAWGEAMEGLEGVIGHL